MRPRSRSVSAAKGGVFWAIRIGCFISGLSLVAGSAASAEAFAPSAVQVLRVDKQAEWRAHAESNDRDRVEKLHDAWEKALLSAKEDGHDGELRKEGILLDPKSGKTGAHPLDGTYRCRTIKVGTPTSGGLGYIAYPAFRCRIWTVSGVTYFEKVTGSQRSAGVIFPDAPNRSIMIGTQAWGDEKGFPRYTADKDRDEIAVIERLEAMRWRIVFPFPLQESLLDVIELTGPQ